MRNLPKDLQWRFCIEIRETNQFPMISMTNQPQSNGAKCTRNATQTSCLICRAYLEPPSHLRFRRRLIRPCLCNTRIQTRYLWWRPQLVHEEASNFHGLGDKCDPKPPAPGRHMHPPRIQASSNTLSSARCLSIGRKSLKVLWRPVSIDDRV